ncbi:MAG: fluoride efflux transporter CrcB [Phycisphaerales bacterium]|nr:fluoride efflux transporter CrcB [Phycisphaerales bacterium]
MDEGVLRFVAVGMGGAIGSMLRYVLAGLVQRSVVSFPLGTLSVNVLGCLAIGFLSERMMGAAVDPIYRIGMLVGVLGGFTTFSTFSLETLNLAEERQYTLAALNVAASVASCLVAAWMGQRLAKWWVMT